MNNKKKKIKIFNQLSTLLNKKNIKWVVVGGLNNYPLELGRDLDIIVKKKDQKFISKAFIKILKKNNIHKFLRHDDRFYGSVIIAFDKFYNFYELHFYPQEVRSGFISLKCNFNDSIIYIENFRVNKKLYAFKNFISTYKTNKIFNNSTIQSPFWLKFFLKNRNFFYLYLNFFFRHPIKFFLNIFRWLKNKYNLVNYSHSNLFFVNLNEEKKIIRLVKKCFLGYFKGIKKIDNDKFYKFYLKLKRDHNTNFFTNFYLLVYYFIGNRFLEKFYFIYTTNPNLLKKNRIIALDSEKKAKLTIYNNIKFSCNNKN